MKAIDFVNDFGQQLHSLGDTLARVGFDSSEQTVGRFVESAQPPKGL
ncbi:MAG: hypothetical protein ACYTBV_17095 [Planctomycetota bacterium]